MKGKNVYTLLILLMLTLSGFFSVAVSAEARTVHALFIILGNDSEIKTSVEKNSEKMTTMLQELSYDCEVQLTVMKSEDMLVGKRTRTTLAKGNIGRPKITDHGIIQSREALEWLERLSPGADDTVLIYYSGHGVMEQFSKKHYLLFAGLKGADSLERAELSEKLKLKQKQRSIRLCMFITDTCSNFGKIPSGDTVVRFGAEITDKARPYLQDLFLEHKGFLDITAASDGEFAFGNSRLGGYFTSALLSQGFTAAADTKNDGNLSWEEAFRKTQEATGKLYEGTTFMGGAAARGKQRTQTPVYYSLPDPTDGSYVPSSLPTNRTGSTDNMVLIRDDKPFLMGSNDFESGRSAPARTVRVDDFWIDVHEVTRGEYMAFLEATAYSAPPPGMNQYCPTDDHPIVGVSWYDAMAYAKWVGKRLPTEAEWEKAARGGLFARPYPWGDAAVSHDRANYGKQYRGPKPVGSYPANDYDLYDMAGNVFEWCLDPMQSYDASQTQNPFGGAQRLDEVVANFESVRGKRVIRGGAWYLSGELPTRVDVRYSSDPTTKDDGIGFRCVRPAN